MNELCVEKFNELLKKDPSFVDSIMNDNEKLFEYAFNSAIKEVCKIIVDETNKECDYDLYDDVIGYRKDTINLCLKYLEEKTNLKLNTISEKNIKI